MHTFASVGVTAEQEEAGWPPEEVRFRKRRQGCSTRPVSMARRLMRRNPTQVTRGNQRANRLAAKKQNIYR